MISPSHSSASASAASSVLPPNHLFGLLPSYLLPSIFSFIPCSEYRCLRLTSKSINQSFMDQHTRHKRVLCTCVCSCRSITALVSRLPTLSKWQRSWRFTPKSTEYSPAQFSFTTAMVSDVIADMDTNLVPVFERIDDADLPPLRFEFWINSRGFPVPRFRLLLEWCHSMSTRFNIHPYLACLLAKLPPAELLQLSSEPLMSHISQLTLQTATAHQISQFFTSPYLSTLNTLNFDGLTMSKESMQSFANCTSLSSSLTKMRIDCVWNDDPSDWDIFFSAKSLQSVKLLQIEYHQNNHLNALLASLSRHASKYLPKLKELEFYDFFPTSMAIVSSSAFMLANITSLEIYESDAFETNGLEELCSSKGVWQKLESLSISHCSVTSLECLANCPNFPRLKHLNLSNNLLDDKDVILFSKSTCFPALEELEIGSNRMIGLDGQYALLTSTSLQSLSCIDASGGEKCQGIEGVREICQKAASESTHITIPKKLRLEMFYGEDQDVQKKQLLEAVEEAKKCVPLIQFEFFEIGFGY